MNIILYVLIISYFVYDVVSQSRSINCYTCSSFEYSLYQDVCSWPNYQTPTTNEPGATGCMRFSVKYVWWQNDTRLSIYKRLLQAGYISGGGGEVTTPSAEGGPSSTDAPTAGGGPEMTMPTTAMMPPPEMTMDMMMMMMMMMRAGEETQNATRIFENISSIQTSIGTYHKSSRTSLRHPRAFNTTTRGISLATNGSIHITSAKPLKTATLQNEPTKKRNQRSVNSSFMEAPVDPPNESMLARKVRQDADGLYRPSSYSPKFTIIPENNSILVVRSSSYGYNNSALCDRISQLGPLITHFDNKSITCSFCMGDLCNHSNPIKISKKILSFIILVNFGIYYVPR